LDSKDKGDRDIIVDAPRLQDHLNDLSKTHFETLTTALDAAKIAWHFDPLLVRGLDYYCHTAFEFITDALGAQGTVLGGGRYDGLSEMLGGPAIAGVGWAGGIERLAMLAAGGTVAVPQLAVVSANSDSDSTAFQLAETIRNAGFSVDLPTAGNMGKKMKKLDKAGIKIALILGDDEIERGVVQLRNLVDGSQNEVAHDVLIDKLSILVTQTDNVDQ
ncbi:MAG: histidine--tRNA ligase, partial [Candidatus Puniceispirillum sp.]